MFLIKRFRYQNTLIRIFRLMKKFLTLLFIPLFGVSQISYKDVMSISDVKQFKKVMIENSFEKNVINDGWLVYGYNIVKDSVNGDTSSKWGLYNLDDDRFMLQFSKEGFFGLSDESDYDNIVKEIKKNCTYYDVIEYTNSGGEVDDFVCYSCPQSKYKGKIGFMVYDGNGVIRHFPNPN